MKSVVGLEAALVPPPTEYPGNFFEGTRFATVCFICFQCDFCNFFFSHFIVDTLLCIPKLFYFFNFVYNSTCHERTPSGPGKSVRSLQVAADQRYFNVEMCRSGH